MVTAGLHQIQYSHTAWLMISSETGDSYIWW